MSDSDRGADIATGTRGAGFISLGGNLIHPKAMVRRVTVPASEGGYAQECFRRLRRNPRDPDALFARAAILASIDRRMEAIASLDLLTEIAPHYPGLWRFKARLYRDAGDRAMEALCSAAADREDATRWN